MATNLDLITAALKLCKVLGETDTASAEQGATALPALNRLVESWTEDGIELGWFEQTVTTDTAPLPKWAERGTISKLAQDQAGIYDEAVIPSWVLDDNANGYGVIRRNALREKLKGANMDHMPAGSGHKGGASIITGE